MVDPKQRSVAEALGELEAPDPRSDKWFVFPLGQDEVASFPDPNGEDGAERKVFASPEDALKAMAAAGADRLNYDILGPVKFAAAMSDTSVKAWWYGGGVESHIDAIQFENWNGRQPISVRMSDGTTVRDEEEDGSDFEFHLFMGRLDPPR